MEFIKIRLNYFSLSRGEHKSNLLDRHFLLMFWICHRKIMWTHATRFVFFITTFHYRKYHSNLSGFSTLMTTVVMQKASACKIGPRVRAKHSKAFHCTLENPELPLFWKFLCQSRVLIPLITDQGQSTGLEMLKTTHLLPVDITQVRQQPAMVEKLKNAIYTYI